MLLVHLHVYFCLLLYICIGIGVGIGVAFTFLLHLCVDGLCMHDMLRASTVLGKETGMGQGVNRYVLYDQPSLRLHRVGQWTGQVLVWVLILVLAPSCGPCSCVVVNHGTFGINPLCLGSSGNNSACFGVSGMHHREEDDTSFSGSLLAFASWGDIYNAAKETQDQMQDRGGGAGQPARF